MELEERFEVTRGLISEINIYHELLKYISFNLHDTKYSLFENEGLFYIWRGLMSMEVLTLSKLIKDNGPYSLQKLINITINERKNVDNELLKNEYQELSTAFDKSSLGLVRDKYLAHQDNVDEEVRTDLGQLSEIEGMATALFELILSQTDNLSFKYEYQESNILKSFKSIFDELDEYEKFCGLITAAQMDGEDSIEVEKFLKST